MIGPVSDRLAGIIPLRLSLNLCPGLIRQRDRLRQRQGGETRSRVVREISFPGALLKSRLRERLQPLVLTCVVTAALLAAAFPAGAQQELDERGLWEIWQQQEAAPEDSAAIVAACEEFKKKHAYDALNGVADTLAAWHLLKLGKRAEAAALFGLYVRRMSNPLGRGASIIASSWLTRMDRAQVRATLQFYYRKEIGYPRTLQDLAAYKGLPIDLKPPYKDRWDQAWSYRLVGLKTIPGLLDQKYELLSRTLGDGSDLAQALTLKYGEKIDAKAVGMRSSTPGREVVDMVIGARARESEIGPKTRTSLVSVGTWTEGMFLAYVGKRILLVCDRHHWEILVRPTEP